MQDLFHKYSLLPKQSSQSVILVILDARVLHPDRDLLGDDQGAAVVVAGLHLGALVAVEVQLQAEAAVGAGGGGHVAVTGAGLNV